MKAQTAMATVPVADIKRARDFYEGTLGLEAKMVEEEMGAVVYQAGDSRIFVYSTKAKSGDATVVSIWVEDLDAAAKELRDKGVGFDQFDLPGTEWKDGIASSAAPDGTEMRSAWFKDPDGNVLAIGEGPLPQ